jgi:hypothetical protein
MFSEVFLEQRKVHVHFPRHHPGILSLPYREVIDEYLDPLMIFHIDVVRQTFQPLLDYFIGKRRDVVKLYRTLKKALAVDVKG